MELYYVIHKNEINLKTGNWNLFSQNFDVIKKVLEMFLIFSVTEHVEIKLIKLHFGKCENFPCTLFVS